jgi:ABC-type uncharacterized transport system ATPase subunit
VIIEHTMRAMVRLAERFIVLDHGRVLAIGAPGEIVKDESVIEAYLGKKWAMSKTALIDNDFSPNLSHST